MSAVDVESGNAVIFQSSGPVMFSSLEKKLGITLHYKGWKMRVLTVTKAGMSVTKDAADATPIISFQLNKINVEEMDHNAQAEGERENGIVVHCHSMDGYETSFRCILHTLEMIAFKEALRSVAKEHNIDEVVRSSITTHVQKAAARRITGGSLSNKSTMRRAIAMAMDTHDKRSAMDRIIAKRGTMKYLPVLFANDLVHGSWWFVLGSLVFVFTSCLTLANAYTPVLGEDDSVLGPNLFRWSWFLMIFCGVFCTLGSMAFMRAVHEDPPMKPLFPDYYHLQSDELLGSWLLLVSCLPIVPYALLYLSTAHHNLAYIGALAIAGMCVGGCSLFVLCCYPSDKPKVKLIQPIAYAMCCCFLSRGWMQYHFNNDWLAATWLMYWGTWGATIVCFASFMYAIAENNPLHFFIYGTGLLESVMFLIGAAYFVTGSYPDGLTREDVDSSHPNKDGDSAKDAQTQQAPPTAEEGEGEVL